MFEGLDKGAYGLILADPPWHFMTYSKKGEKKSPQAHYQTAKVVDMIDAPVMELATDNCVLVMWATFPHLPQAILLMTAWGFTYKTGGAWHKTTANGKTAFGTGYILRSACEPFLIGTRGKPKWGSRSLRNLIISERREHSRKPPEMRALCEALVPGVRKCELFARSPWPGADVWGHETTKFGD